MRIRTDSRWWLKPETDLLESRGNLLSSGGSCAIIIRLGWLCFDKTIFRGFTGENRKTGPAGGLSLSLRRYLRCSRRRSIMEVPSVERWR